MKNNLENKTLEEKLAKILLWFGIGVFLLFFIWTIWQDWNTSFYIDKSTASEIGDFLGGFVGSIWSLAGILLFYSALKLQRKDLQNQQEEIKLQREEMKLQRKEFEKNNINTILYRQIDMLNININKILEKHDYIEGTVNKIIDKYKELVNSLRLDRSTSSSEISTWSKDIETLEIDKRESKLIVELIEQLYNIINIIRAVSVGNQTLFDFAYKVIITNCSIKINELKKYLLFLKTDEKFEEKLATGESIDSLSLTRYLNWTEQNIKNESMEEKVNNEEQ